MKLKRLNVSRPRAVAQGAVAAIALLSAVFSAHATLGSPSVKNDGGAMEGISYGSTGNVFETGVYLSVSGLGAPNDPKSIVTLNPELDYAFGSSGAGTSLLQLSFSITNQSLTDTFTDLRFLFFINPDGEQTNFLDVATESWGGGAANEAARRAVISFDSPNPLTSDFISSGNLTDGSPAAECAASTGCDAIAALQWNLASLGPTQQLTVTVGLSDDGSTLSSRLLTFTGVGTSTTLTLSGIATVSSVPEPAGWATLALGLLAVGGWRRRRDSAH
jgi:MYXO-CTERM domain-containing protein